MLRRSQPPNKFLENENVRLRTQLEMYKQANEALYGAVVDLLIVQLNAARELTEAYNAAKETLRAAGIEREELDRFPST